MHKVNSLRMRRKQKGLPKSEQTYRSNIKNFAEILAEKPKKEVKKKVEKPKAKLKPKKTKKEDK